MSEYKLGEIEAICMMIILIINTIVLNIPNLIILSTESGAIINVVYISFISIFFAIIVLKLFESFKGKDILDICDFFDRKIFRKIIGVSFILFLLLLSIVAVKYLSSSIKIIYFNTSPNIYLLLFFIIPAILLNILGLKSISGVNMVFILFIFISFLFLFILSYENITISKMFPLLGNGFNATFVKGSTNIFAFSNIPFIFFLPSLIKKDTSFEKVTIVSTIVSSIVLIFSITTFILTLPIVTESDEMLSIYLLTRMVGFGNFLERFDAFFIFSWIITLLSSLSISMFFILRILKKLFNLQDEKNLSLPIGLIILGGCQLIKNYSQIKILGNSIYRYGYIILVFGLSLSILCMANFKKRKLNRRI